MSDTELHQRAYKDFPTNAEALLRAYTDHPRTEWSGQDYLAYLWLRMWSRQFDRCLEEAQEALEVCRRRRSASGIFQARAWVALGHSLRQQHDFAISELGHLLDNFRRQVRSARDERFLRYVAAVVYTRAGRVADSVSQGQLFLALPGEPRESTYYAFGVAMEAAICQILGARHEHVGLQAAQDYLGRAVAIWDELKIAWRMAAVRAEYGSLRESCGDPSGSLQCYYEAAPELLSTYDRAGIYINIGRCLMHLGRLAEAQMAIWRAFPSIKPRPDYVAEAHTELGLLLLRGEQFDLAREHFSQALDLAQYWPRGLALIHAGAGLASLGAGAKRKAHEAVGLTKDALRREVHPLWRLRAGVAFSALRLSLGDPRAEFGLRTQRRMAGVWGLERRFFIECLQYSQTSSFLRTFRRVPTVVRKQLAEST